MKTNTTRRALAILLALSILVGLFVPAFAYTQLGDVNGDGKITVFDVQMLAEVQAGLRQLTNQQQNALGNFSFQDILDFVLGKKTPPEASSNFQPYAGGSLGNLDGYVWDDTAEAFVPKSGTSGDASYAPDGQNILSGKYSFSVDVTPAGDFSLTARVSDSLWVRYGVEMNAEGALVVYSDYANGADTGNRIDHQTVAAPANLGVIVNGDRVAMLLNGAMVYERVVSGIAGAELVIAGNAQLRNIAAEDDDAKAAEQYTAAAKDYVAPMTLCLPEGETGYYKVTETPAESKIFIDQSGSKMKPIAFEFMKDGSVLDGEAWAISMNFDVLQDPAFNGSANITLSAVEDENNSASILLLRKVGGTNGFRRYIFIDGTRNQASGNEIITDHLQETLDWQTKLTLMFYNQKLYLFLQEPGEEYELVTSYTVDWERCSPRIEVTQYADVTMSNIVMTNDPEEVAALHTQLAKPAQIKDSADVLFLGNSMIFYYDIPNVLARIAKSAGYYVEASAVARSSAVLQNFTTEGNMLHDWAVKELERGYDAVFLQEISTCTSSESLRQRTKTQTALLDEMITAAGGTTYSYVRPPMMEKDGVDNVVEGSALLDDLYGQIYAEQGVENAYVNRAFVYAYLNTDLDVWYTDKAQPSEYGAYLTACVIFSTLFDTSCQDLGYANIPAEDAELMQSIADKVVFGEEENTDPTYFPKYDDGKLGNRDGYVWDEAAQAFVTASGTNGMSTYAPDQKTPLSGNYSFSADVTLPQLVAEGGFYLTAYVDHNTNLRYGVEAQADGSLVLFSDYQDGSDNNNRIDHQTIASPTFPMNLGVIVCGDHMAMTLNGALVYDRAVKGVADSDLVISGSKMMVAQLKNIVAEDNDTTVATAYAAATANYKHNLVGLLTEMPPEPVMKQNATETYFVNGYSRVTQKPETNFVRAVAMNYSSTNPIGVEFYKDGNVLDGEAWALSMDLLMKVDGAKTRTASMTFHVTKDADNGAGFKFIRDMDGVNGIRRFIFRDGTRLQGSGDEVVKDLEVAANWAGKVTIMFYDQVIYLFVQQPGSSAYELITSYPVDWDRCSPQLEVFQYMSVEMSNLSMTNDLAEVQALHQQLAVPENPIDTAKILFLGNSCTFYYDMPNVLARLAKNAGYYVEVNTVARSSSRMDMFVTTTDYLYTLSQAEIARDDYDLVFIQGLSSDIDSADRQQRAIQGATDLAALLREAGETPAMFVRPSRKLRDMDGDGSLESFVVYEDSKGYEELFGGIAKDLNMDAYYVNRAFALAYQENNDVNLWYSDDAHSNARGAYLTACVLFATYFNTSCENVGDDGLPAADAAFLREIADRVVLKGEMPNWD